MIPWRSVIVTGLGGVLALALCGEMSDVFDGTPSLSIAAGLADIATPLTPPGVAGTAAVDTAAILSRPLFNWNRRTQAGAGSIDGPLPRLSGIIISAAGRYAIFAAPGGSKPQTVPQGGSLGRFTVDSITSDHVTVRNGASSQSLQTHFGPTPPPPMALPDAS